uniref:CRAL-TRIO domain-containing protein n=1 Tax=Stomoxys calcitrans TaxID=35570 RepID=A0A1I8PF31_STOCA|nr:unnamed protein product [Stomoxys calcitrans]
MWPLFDLEKQYATNPQIKREEIQKLKEWLRTQPHMPELLEHEILLFYRACNFQLEYTKQVIDKYFTFRTHAEEFFADLDVESPQILQAQQVMACFPLKGTTAEGYRVAVSKLLDPDPAKYDFVASFKITFSTQDMWLQGQDLMPGVLIMLDLSGFSLGHFVRIGLPQIKKILNYLQEAVPSQVIGLHFVNPSAAAEKLMNLLNQFMKNNMKTALVVHPNLESLHKHIPRDILPQEYGGTEATCAELAEIYYTEARKYRMDIIEYNNSRRVKEELRPASDRNTVNNFGAQGNFKKIDID